MKKLSLIVFLLVFVRFHAQNNWISFNRNYFLDLSLPFSDEAQQFAQEGKTVSGGASRNQNILVTAIKTPKFSWAAGITYKELDFRVKDRISLWKYTEDYDNGQIYVALMYHFKDPADFVAKSKNYGFINQFSYSLFSKEKTKHYVGLDIELYFWEYYSAWYESDDFNPKINPGFILEEEDRPKPNTPPSDHFFLSAASTAVFYKFLYTPWPEFSVGAKFLFGTNLKSDWDEFKKYSWLGFGIELGFGTRKAWSKKSE